MKLRALIEELQKVEAKYHGDLIVEVGLMDREDGFASNTLQSVDAETFADHQSLDPQVMLFGGTIGPWITAEFPPPSLPLPRFMLPEPPSEVVLDSVRAWLIFGQGPRDIRHIKIFLQRDARCLPSAVPKAWLELPDAQHVTKAMYAEILWRAFQAAALTKAESAPESPFDVTGAP